MASASIYDALLVLPGLKLIATENPAGASKKQLKKLKRSIPEHCVGVFIQRFDKSDNGSLRFLRDQKVALEVTYQSLGVTHQTGTAGSKENVNKKKTVDDRDDKDDDVDDVESMLEEMFPADLAEDPRTTGRLSVSQSCKSVDSESHSINGYDTFILNSKMVWKSDTKTIDTIELQLVTTENVDEPSPDNRGAGVGESYVIDHTGNTNEIATNRVLFLNWDMHSILLREISSPEDIQLMTSETEIPNNVLLLGIHGTRIFDPSKPLCLNVRLHDYLDVDRDHGRLTLKLYDKSEFESDSTKVLDDMIEESILKSYTSKGDDFLATTSLSGTFQGYIKFEITPDKFHQALQTLLKRRSDDRFHILEKDRNERLSKRVILHVVKEAEFSIVIEDDNGQPVAVFLLSSIASNSHYFDSAVEMLKSPSNRSVEKVTLWSNMMMTTTHSNWDTVFPDVAYNKARIKSKPLDSESAEDKTLQKFRVIIELPKNSEVESIDGDDVTLLVENCDSNLDYDNQVGRFIYLRKSSKVTLSPDGSVIRFDWSGRDKEGVAKRKAEMRVSVLLVEPSKQDGGSNQYTRLKKIGQTAKIFKQVGGRSREHLSKLKLRNIVRLRLENSDDIERSFSNFLEITLKMAFIFTIQDEQDPLLLTVLEKVSDDFASQFYEETVKGNSSKIYQTIIKSKIFSPRIIDDVKVVTESETAEIVAKVFGLLLKYHRDELLGWTKPILEDEDALELIEDDQNLEELLEKYVRKFVRVLKMESSDLISQLEKHPVHKDAFFEAGVLVRDENDMFLNKPESYLEELVQGSATMQDTVGKVERSIENTVFSRNVVLSEEYTGNTSDMESNLIGMLDRVVDVSDTCSSMLDGFTDTLDVVSGLLSQLNNFTTTVNSLSRTASSLYLAVSRFWKSFESLARFAAGPLAIVKTLASVFKIPMRTLLSALKRGTDLITSLNSRVTVKLKKLTTGTITKKINTVSEMAEKPKTALSKFVEIIDKIISFAKLGVLPMALISKFASSTNLSSFFSTLNDNFNSIKTVIDNIFNQTNVLQPHITKMIGAAKTISKAASLLSPVDYIIRKLQPFINVVNSILGKVFSWWNKWLFDALMWPVEKAINLIVNPFRGMINDLIRRINPFGFVDNLLNQIASPLDLLPSPALLIGKLDLLDEYQNSSKFEEVTESFILGVAIILRGLLGMFSTLLLGAANSLEDFEQMMGEVDADGLKVMEKLLDEMQIEFPQITMSDVILHLKNKSIDYPMLKCDAYLQMNASNHSYEKDQTSGKVVNYIRDTSESSELTHCVVDPSYDKQHVLFKQGTADNSWMMSPMSLLLYYANMTEQAVQIGLLPSSSKVEASFLPEEMERGMYKVSLYPEMNGLITSFEIDSRLPIKKTTLNIGPDIAEMPENIINYAKERILAPVDSTFSEVYSWALVEKVVACKLDVTCTTRESVGTGIYLLSGKQSGVCYKRESGTQWRKFSADRLGQHNKYATVELTGTGERVTGEALLAFIKQQILSTEEVELLGSLHRVGSDDRNIYDITTMKQAIKNLSMFVMVTSAPKSCAHPILCTDNTSDRNVTYANGEIIQPLFDLSNIVEIWEYPITSSNRIAKQQQVRSLSISTEISSHIIPPISTRREWCRIPSCRSKLAVQVIGESTPTIKQQQPIIIKTRSSPRGLINELISAIPLGAGVDKLLLSASEEITEGFKSPRTIKEGHYIEYSVASSGRGVKQIGHVQGIVTKMVPAVPAVPARPKAKLKKVVLYYVVRQINRSNGYGSWTKDIKVSPDRKPKKLSGDDLRKNFIKMQYLALLQEDKIFYRDDDEKKWGEVREAKKKEQWERDMDNEDKVQYWGTTLADMKKYVRYCAYTYPHQWNMAMKNRGKGGVNGEVSIEELSTFFIQDHTKGLGSGIALNMTRERKKVDVLVSVAWNDGINEVIAVLDKAVKNKEVISRGKVFNNNTPIWFSAFALFQAKDGEIPSVQDQLKINVFRKVVSVVSDMFVIQTCLSDPYSRLWFVSELHEAFEKNRKEAGSIKIHPLFSETWKNMYLHQHKKEGNYKWVQQGTTWVKTKELEGSAPDKWLILGEKVSKSIGFYGSGPRYYLMGTKETLKEKDAKDDDKLIPILKNNVTRGLTTSGNPTPRQTDEKQMTELDGIDKTWWNRMQSKIADLQLNALNAKPARKLSYSLSALFVEQYNIRDNNESVIDKINSRKEHYDKRAFEIIGYKPQINGAYLEFNADRDDDATTYFTQGGVMPLLKGLSQKYTTIGGVEYLLSFGSGGNVVKVDSDGKETRHFQFPWVQNLASSIDGTYVDSQRLPQMAGSYLVVGNIYPRNVFWREYYKHAMALASIMVFIITDAWIISRNCWEELDWAKGIRPSKKNIFFFMGKNVKNKIEFGPIKDTMGNMHEWKTLKESFTNKTEITVNVSKGEEMAKKRLILEIIGVIPRDPPPT